jgi:hypothetical protein
MDTAVFLITAAIYVTPLFVPDPSLLWAADDEVCCHIPSIKAIHDEGLLQAVKDTKRYRTATTPLYHMLMSVVLGRVDPAWLRMFWIVVALAVGFLLYHHVRTDPALGHGERAGLALATTYLLSPTIRASAVYFVTDGLAVHLAIAALVLLRRARAGPKFSTPLGVLAIVAAYASFYTRQFYLWTALYVAYSVVSEATCRRARIATMTACLLLAAPAISLFAAWRGFTTPLGFAVHTHPILLSTVPNALGLLGVYSLPLAWIATRDSADDRRGKTIGRQLWVSLIVVGGLVLYVAACLALGFEIPESGGILRMVRVFGSFDAVVFLLVSYLGLLMVVRWFVTDGLWQTWWVVFLVPLFAGSIVLQRYFEPAVLVFMFLVARPRDALKVLDSRPVWFYPLFTAAYALSRTIYFASNV